jgi:hypothetical protein
MNNHIKFLNNLRFKESILFEEFSLISILEDINGNLYIEYLNKFVYYDNTYEIDKSEMYLCQINNEFIKKIKSFKYKEDLIKDYFTNLDNFYVCIFDHEFGKYIDCSLRKLEIYRDIEIIYDKFENTYKAYFFGLCIFDSSLDSIQKRIRNEIDDFLEGIQLDYVKFGEKIKKYAIIWRNSDEYYIDENCLKILTEQFMKNIC